MSQVQEFQRTLHDIYVKDMVIYEFFQVVVIIEKIPLSWKQFRNYLRHKNKEMRVENHILRVKEDNKVSNRRANSSSIVPKVIVKEESYLKPFFPCVVRMDKESL